MANDHGHAIARLPPYHCHLNPIELIWGQVKQEIRTYNSNGNQSMARVEQLTREAFARVTPLNWFNCVNHKKEKKLNENTGKKTEQQIIFLNGS